MVSKEELEAMGISKSSSSIPKNNISKNNIPKQKENVVSIIIKVIALVGICIGIFVGLISVSNNSILGISIIIASVVSSVFIYALGEIIQLLEDIKNK